MKLAYIETTYLLHKSVSTWVTKWQWVMLKARVHMTLNMALVLSQIFSGTLIDKTRNFCHNSLCHPCGLCLIRCNPAPMHLRNHPMISLNSSATFGDVISEATKVAHMAVITTLKCDSLLRRSCPLLGRPPPSPQAPLFLIATVLEYIKNLFPINPSSASYWLILKFFSTLDSRIKTPKFAWVRSLNRIPQASTGGSSSCWC